MLTVLFIHRLTENITVSECLTQNVPTYYIRNLKCLSRMVFHHKNDLFDCTFPEKKSIAICFSYTDYGKKHNVNLFK